MLSCFHVQVGPLPIGPDSAITPLTADGAIPWIKRPQNDYGEQFEWVRSPSRYT